MRQAYVANNDLGLSVADARAAPNCAEASWLVEVSPSVRSNTPKGFIIEFEKSGRIAKVLWRSRDFDALAAIRTALEAAGVEFANGDEPGVKLKRQPE